MKPSPSLKLLAIAAGLLVLASACVPIPTDVSWTTLSLMNDQIVLPFHDRVSLIDPLDGSGVELRDGSGSIRLDDQGNPRLWALTSGGHCIPECFYTRPIALDEATLLVANYNKKLYRVDLGAARILNPEGRALTDHVVGNLVDAGDLIYVPYAEGDLAALDRSLSEVWRFDTTKGIWATPLLLNGTLYVASLDHHLYALDAVTGVERWRVDLGGALISAPTYHDGFLYIGSFARKIFKVSLDGQVRAEFETADWVWGSPEIVEDVLYVGDQAGNVYALGLRSDGFSPLWQRKVANGAVRATPLVVGDQVIVGSRDRHVYWLDRVNGSELIRREMRGEVLANPLLVEPSETLPLRQPLVIISTMAREESAVAFTLDNGERRWVFAF